MSAALAILGSIACLLAFGLLIALAVLARVEEKHEDAVGIRTAERPAREGTSGDVHLFVGFPASMSIDARFSAPSHVVPADDAAVLLRELASSLDGATHGHADFGRFQPIAIRAVEGAAFVYLHVRTRKPIPTFLDLGARANYRTTLEALATLAPAGIVELEVGHATISSDPADGRPTTLV